MTAYRLMMMALLPGPARRTSAFVLLRDLLVRPAPEEQNLVPAQRRIVPDLDAIPVLPLQPAQPVGVLLHQMHRHVGMHPENQLLLLGALPHAAEHPLDLESGRLHGEDLPRPLALRTVLIEVVCEARPLALTRHLDQPQLAHRERLRARPVPAQVLPQRVRDRLAILLVLHVDEVEDDDPAEIPETKLARDLGRRLEVRLQDRLFLALLPREAPGVHVDRDQRLGLVDRDVAPLLEPHLALHRLLDLRLDLEVVEDRGLAAIELHARPKLGRVRGQVFQDALVLLLRVDHQLIHVLVEDVADQPGGELHLLMEERRGLRPLRLALDLGPELFQILDVALELLLSLLRSDRADDDARVPGADLAHHPFQSGALGPVLDLSRDTDVLAPRSDPP